MTQLQKRILSVFLFLLIIAPCIVAFSACKDTKYEESEMIRKANDYINANVSSVNQRFKGNYHLSPQIGWMNDPNGFVYFKGTYHVFWQYYPYSTDCGPMHWGHATSTDLVKWQYQPVALAPDQEYDADGCWSGSAIVVGNRLYLIYTGHYERNGIRMQTQCLAYSDDGIHFIKYDKNPIIGQDKLPEGTNIADFRDPYVWQHDDNYYMLVGTMEQGAAKVLTYVSKDLHNWNFLDNLLRQTNAGYCWECPSLVNLDGTDIFVCSPVDYPHQAYAFWNYNSNVYATGTVDYKTGTMSASKFTEIDYGLDFYAAQLIKGAENKTIMTAWMNMWARTFVPAQLGDGWTGSLILPREVSLSNGRLIQKPVSGIANYYQNRVQVADTINGEQTYQNVDGTCVHLDITADMSASNEFSIRLFADSENYTELTYNKKSGLLTIDRSANKYTISADGRDLSEGTNRIAKYVLANNVLRLELFLDKSSVEVFVGEGELTMTALTYNDTSASGIVFISNGSTNVKIVKDDIVINGR